MTHLNSLISHDHWASHQLISTLDKADAWTLPARRLMDHMLSAHNHWYARVAGMDPTRALWDAEYDKSEYAGEVERYYDLWKEVLRSDLPSRKVDYKNSKGHGFSNTIEEILLHLCMHSQYHRGQIVTLTRGLLETVPALDMIAFYRESSTSM